MMKNNRFSYGGGVSKPTILFKGIVIIFVLSILSYAHVQHLATPVALSVTEPVLKEQGVVRESFFGLLALIKTKSSLIIENRELRRQLAEEQGKHVLINMLRNDLENLAFGFAHLDEKVVAPIISRPPVSLYDTALIAIDGPSSVEVGDYVAAAGGAVIGFVDAVFGKTARIRFFSSAGESHTFVLHKKNVPIVVVGVGGGMMQAVVPKDMDVEVGDVFVLPERRAAPVGTVAALGVASAGSLKVLGIMPLVNMQEIGFVGVMPLKKLTATTSSAL